MFIGLGRRIRITLSPKRAGFKKPVSYYHRRKRDLPESLPANLRLRGKARTRGLRAEMRREAALFRSPLRWLAVSLAWGTLFWGFFAFPIHRYSLLHVVLGILAVVAFFAAFSLNPVMRGVCSVALAGGGLAGLLYHYPPLLAGSLVVAGLTLLPGAAPVGRRRRREAPAEWEERRVPAARAPR